MRPPPAPLIKFKVFTRFSIARSIQGKHPDKKNLEQKIKLEFQWQSVSKLVPALQSIWFYNTLSDVWYEHFLTKRSGNNKPSSLIIRCVVSCIQSSYTGVAWCLRKYFLDGPFDPKMLQLVYTPAARQLDLRTFCSHCHV